MHPAVIVCVALCAVLTEGKPTLTQLQQGVPCTGCTLHKCCVFMLLACMCVLFVCVPPVGHPYVGVDFTRGICGVSIIRSGEAMETALRECCQGVKVGKILVHRCVFARARGWVW